MYIPKKQRKYCCYYQSFHVPSFYFDVAKQEQLVNEGLNVGYELCLLGY